MNTLYAFQDVCKVFATPSGGVEILKAVNLTVYEGEALGIVGASGSGKSTLLYLMGALDVPSSGSISFAGQDLLLLNAQQKAHFRNKTLGFVFQFHHLLPEFSAEENVVMPAVIGGSKLASVLPEARLLLQRVGLANRTKARINTLSGGERQRVAIARAILLKPRVLLADEPTGNLDEQTGRQIGSLLRELNRELGMTMVIVTHNPELASQMDRNLELKAGELYEKNFV